MRTNYRRMAGRVLLLIVVGLAERAGTAQEVKAHSVKLRSGLPIFQVDPSWPRLPEKLKLGMVTGIAVDAQDHVWVLHRPATVEDRENSAPPVVEFDANGTYVRGWGGPGEGYDWPDENEHGIFIDHQGNVWIGAGGGPDRTVNQILKFTKAGKFLLQIGHRGRSKGSNDVENLNNAADAYVYPKTKEVFVADGYVNRRVIVFDATTGVFKRYWGAYGNKPDDTGERGQNIQQFAIVHDVRVSHDGVVYVAARQDGRIQTFTLDGKFLKEVFLDKDTKEGTGVASIAFSSDPKQKFMYVLDLNKGIVHILNRRTLETVGSFGRSGGNPGEFRIPHNIAADSRGNLYITELGERRGDKWAGRVQKFLYKGLSPP